MKEIINKIKRTERLRYNFEFYKNYGDEFNEDDFYIGKILTLDNSSGILPIRIPHYGKGVTFTFEVVENIYYKSMFVSGLSCINVFIAETWLLTGDGVAQYHSFIRENKINQVLD